ncbi:hypothetical protein HPE56_13125 [Maribacter sp. ANRC-HE7]|uniref:Lipocalin-like domain-containing protein n=1 Tax=Maribacter aquimaris TaxID=2737171 RepID=A0ABR7V1T9_9FLAO|nr:hypothetical protein [Maribacter aquimaris]MBD0778738.1 hypothetical protein [Maribacter aquimaris]
MKRLLFFGFLSLMTACQKNVSQEDLPFLNGYWEIAKVNMPDGQTKEYTINTTVDYIEMKDLSGFRKKVYPKLDGTFDTSNDTEEFTVVNQNNIIELHYKTNLSEWVETLNTLDQDSFSVTNTDKITYTYKRFQPIKVQK